MRVDFALADALKGVVQIKVKGKGYMAFEVKYQDVPHFCFCCGRIGHSERECPDEDLCMEMPRFGVELRACTFKRALGRQLASYMATPAVKKGLNISGAQKIKVTSMAGSSSVGGGWAGRSFGAGGSGGRDPGRGGGDDAHPRSWMSGDMEGELSRGVQDMAVDEPGFDGTQSRLNRGGNDRVSGLNSFADSSGSSLTEGREEGSASPSLSMHERLLFAKGKDNGTSMVKAKSSCAKQDCLKAKKWK